MSSLIQHMFKVNGGAPWAIATDVEAVRALLSDSEFDVDVATASIEQLPDDEPFTMIYDDIPDELRPFVDCTHDKDESHGECVEDCGEDLHAVTMTAAQWAAQPQYCPDDELFGST